MSSPKMHKKASSLKFRWAAPEVIASSKYSEKSDVWSYGATLVEIYSRADPFSDFTDDEVANKGKSKIQIYSIQSSSLRKSPNHSHISLTYISSSQFCSSDRKNYPNDTITCSLRAHNRPNTIVFLLTG